jgi:hypothetical protein
MRADLVGGYSHELAGYDLVGDGSGDYLVGDDLLGDDILGELYPEADVRRNALVAAAVANRRVAEGAIVKDMAPTKAREFILGFDSTAVPGSTSANITKRPQVIFRPERVVIPSAVGVDFQVVDIKVGKNSQFSASGEVPAVVFAETSFGVRLKMDTCQVSMDVTISVRNTNAAQRNFTAAIIGPAVE